MRHYFFKAAALVVLCAAEPLVASPAVDTDEAPEFYQPPSTLPAGPSGTIIRQEQISSGAALGNAKSNWLIMYKSKDIRNNPIAVTGTVAIPTGNPPSGGWPVISWGHGTTGTADKCAPSHNSSDFPAKGYVDRVNKTLSEYVANGYVVVKTDYEGLGTPGPHPYIIGDSEARGMIDIVRAARNMDSSVGHQWLAMGHSQGGHAAIFTSRLGPVYAPRLKLVGAVAIAPGSQMMSLPPYLKNRPNANMFPLLPLILQGAAAGSDAFDPTTILTPTGEKKLKLADTQCASGLRAAESWGRLKVKDVIKEDADLSAFADILNDLGGASHVQPTVPLLVIQATNDQVVAMQATDKTVAELCHLSTQITYSKYTVAEENLNGPAAGHRGAIDVSVADTQEWIASRFKNEPLKSTCLSAK